MENLSLLSKLEHSISKLNKKNAIYILCSVAFLIIFYFLFISGPADFPSGVIVKIEPGMSLRNVSAILNTKHIIRSRVAFESFAIIMGVEKHIISANYLFENKLPVFKIARR